MHNTIINKWIPKTALLTIFYFCKKKKLKWKTTISRYIWLNKSCTKPALNNCCAIIHKHRIERGIEIKGKLLNHKIEPVLIAI